MSTIGLVGYIAIIGYLVTNATEGETIQIADAKFGFPFIMRYINTLQKCMFSFIIISAWICYRLYFNMSTNIIRKNTEYNAFAWFIFYITFNAILFAICGILVNISLEGHTITVPTSNAISGSKPVFVLLLSVIFLQKKLTLWDVMAVFVAMIGILFFVLELSSSNHNCHNNETYDTYYGIILTILWTLGYAIGDIIAKKIFIYCYDKDRIMISSILCLCAEALISSLLFWWFLLYPQKLNINSLSVDACFWVLINGMNAIVLDICVYVAIFLTSPFYVSIASQLSTPMAFILDVFVHDYKFNIYAICGTVFILFAFLMLDIMKPSDNICSCFTFCNVALINKKKEMETVNQNDLNDSMHIQNTEGFNDLSQSLVNKSGIQ